MKNYYILLIRILTKPFVYALFITAITFNIFAFYYPERLISSRCSVPLANYTYCDVYLLTILVIAIYFSCGQDFSNSMEELSLASGKSRTNRFILMKSLYLLLIYVMVYVPTYLNLYNGYKKVIAKDLIVTPIGQAIFYSAMTNLFVISLALLILYITRSISVSIMVYSFIYIIEEFLWKSYIMRQHGILNHLWSNETSILTSSKLCYILVSIFILYGVLKLGGRQKHMRSTT